MRIFVAAAVAAGLLSAAPAFANADLAKAKIPWFGSWGFFTSEWKDPWMFPAHMASVHEAHANSIYVRDVFKLKTVGILYLNIPEDRAAVKAMGFRWAGAARLRGGIEGQNFFRVPDRGELQHQLAGAGIGTGIHYPVPLHLQKAYANLAHQPGDFPVAERVSKEILSLPMFPGLTEAQQNRVAERVIACVRAAPAKVLEAGVGR